MADKRNRDHPEHLWDELAESVFRLSDEAILAESTETGTDPQEEAERTRLVLQQALQSFESVNRRLSNLGHTINPTSWRSEGNEYHNRCLNCGSIVTFTADEPRNLALYSRCPTTIRGG
jgi:hypothetical protein